MDQRDEARIRSRTAAIPLEWVEGARGPVDGADRTQFVDLIIAAHLVADEGRLALHRWIDAGRRAGLSWTEIGVLLGISKQAAQQRFGGPLADKPEAPAAEIEVRGATALNEMGLLEAEGGRGRELVAVGPLRLLFRQTALVWEYRRIVAIAPTGQMSRLRAQGWSHVASWFPFHYFKRQTRRTIPDAGENP
jgi:hypothetical protein